MCCADDLHVIEVLASSDEALPKLAARLAQTPAARQPPPPTLHPLDQARESVPHASVAMSSEASPAQKVRKADSAGEPAAEPGSRPESLPAFLPMQQAAFSHSETSAQPSAHQSDVCVERLPGGQPLGTQADLAKQQRPAADSQGQYRQTEVSTAEPLLALHDVSRAAADVTVSAQHPAQLTELRTGDGGSLNIEADCDLTQNVPESIPRQPRFVAAAHAAACGRGDSAVPASGLAASVGEEAAAGLSRSVREQGAVADLKSREVTLASGCGPLHSVSGGVIDPHQLAPAGPMPAS